MLRVETPATLVDMAELGRARSRMEWAVLREMWSGGKTFALRAGEDLVGLCGIYPVSETGGEAWFNLTPAAADHINPLIRAIRLTLRATAYREIVTICSTRAGKVLARRAGLTFAETCELGEIWAWKR